MNVTINQIRQEMTTLVQAHEMVNSFFWGDFHRAYNEKEQFYPLVCSYLSDGAINTNMTQMQLVVIVCDKTFKGFENLNDTESDTLTIARHLYNVIRQSPRWNALLRVNSSTFTKFYENTSDEVAGVILTMNVDLKQSRSLCDLPLDNYDFDGTFVGNDCEPVLIVNSDQSFSFNAPSGTIVELPDTPVLVTDQDGNPLGGESVPSVTGGTIEVTITPTPCADATFEINGIEVATIPSGDTGSIQVLQGGFEVGALSGGNWVVPPCPLVLPCNKLPTKSGQTVSYATGDDGDDQRAREVSFFILTNNNPFGHNRRFTGTNGGYHDGVDFRDKDGVVTTKALAFPDDIMLDWAYYNGDNLSGQVMMWYINNTTLNLSPAEDREWDNMLILISNLNQGGFTNWKMPNILEFMNISFYGTNNYGYIYYQPLDVQELRLIWINQTLNADATRAYRYQNLNANIITNSVKNNQANATRLMAVRYGNYTTTGGNVVIS